MFDLKPIANRAADGEFHLPADNWIQVVPLGEFDHDRTGLTQICDRVAISAMTDQFQNGSELLVDFDHESWDNDKRTQAAGWIQNLEARADGLWARIRWSKSGADSVSGGDYRFLSPVFRPDECQPIGDGRVRPLRLAGAGLTNRPNTTVAAIANRSDEPAGAGDALDAWNNLVLGIRAERKTTFAAAWAFAQSSKPQVWQRLLDSSSEGGSSSSLSNRMAGNASCSKDAPAPSLTQTGDPVCNWESKVALVQKLEDISFERAWEKAKTEHPRAWVQYQQEYERQMGEREQRVNNL